MSGRRRGPWEDAANALPTLGKRTIAPRTPVAYHAEVPVVLVLAVLVSVAATGCYRSHGRDRFAPSDAGGRDAADSPRLDAPGARDAGRTDAGPPRELRWVELAAGAEPRPDARMHHFAVVDEERDRLVVLGGIDPYCCGSPGLRNDAWALDLRTETWTFLGGLARPIVGTTAVEAALDLPRNRIVIVGAVFEFGPGLPATLAVDLATLAVTTLPPGPWPGEAVPLRAAHDADAARIVVHDAFFIERTAGVWIFDLTTDRWSTVTVTGGPEQLFHTPLTMVARDRALIYSGYTGDVGSASIWELDLSARRFSRLPLVAEMGGRFSHRAVFDEARGSLVVFGGTLFTVDRGTLLFDVAAPSIAEPIVTPAPGGRRDYTLVMDRRRRRAIAFGGAEQSEHAYADTWALELP